MQITNTKITPIIPEGFGELIYLPTDPEILVQLLIFVILQWTLFLYKELLLFIYTIDREIIIWIWSSPIISPKIGDLILTLDISFEWETVDLERIDLDYQDPKSKNIIDGCDPNNPGSPFLPENVKLVLAVVVQVFLNIYINLLNYWAVMNAVLQYWYWLKEAGIL